MRDIPGYEGLYAITPCGKVWSYRRNKFIENHENNWGYYDVHLYKNGNHKVFKVHRLVALTYIPNPNNLPEVNHINEDKSNNSISNLEWCTSRYNANYGTRNQKISKKCKCINTGKIFNSAKSAAEDLGVNKCSVDKVCRGDRKSILGLQFIYIQ